LQDLFILSGSVVILIVSLARISCQAIPEFIVVMKAGYEIGGVFKGLKSGQVLGVVGVDEPAKGATHVKGGDIFCQRAGIESDKDIRGDAPPAKYGPFCRSQGLIGRSLMLGCSVSVQYFPVRKAVVYFLIIVVMAFAIGLLNARPVGV